MSRRDEAEHDPQEDALIHAMCDRWADKLALTRVEHLSPDERSTFELHLRSCPHCRELVMQYRVVDSYFYGFLLAEHMPAMAKAPKLPACLRIKGRLFGWYLELF
jgi:hypothetical protein